MKRRLHQLAAAVLLILAAACVIELGVSFRWTHVVKPRGVNVTLATCKGNALVAVERVSIGGWFWDTIPTSQTKVDTGVVGFKWQRDTWGTLVGLPLWLLAGVFAWTARWLLKRANPPLPGHCPVCGYDLRATPDRCPECGTLPA